MITAAQCAAGLRVVGDVHGDARAFAHALATDRFVIQLGDLTDSGPDSAGALRLMLGALEAGRGLFLLGNHDYKLARALSGGTPRIDLPLAETLASLDADLAAQTLEALAQAPVWLRLGGNFFVHGGFHPTMLLEDAPLPHDFSRRRVEGVLARALHGEPTGQLQANGLPVRSLRWVDRIPAGLTVYCGHDRRSCDGRPYIRKGAGGGRAVFLDTGAGKGGHLSWIDLPAP